MTAIICMALSALGVVIAVLAAVRGRRRAALRWLALALVPTGLYLTGLITVFHTIGSALAHWATHLVFDPRVWVGVSMLGAAVLILLATGVRRRRRQSGGQVAGRPAPAAAAPGRAAAPGAPLPAKSAPTADLGDFSDIEEILKKRGI
ncbi:hypothetical protein [Streptacidiphilus rugosus]|uniref:hypothetical protein n=1 Tax=Streptacidiphilus rugosus TaxID=405783 RepID=UPI00068A819E|nr:hypothetical protein [Streptacidiphilus rugosus]